MSGTDAIMVGHLSKRFDATLAVDDISFSIARGSTAALLGGNGAGKTTTLSMLLGLLDPSGGEITVLDSPMPAGRFPVRLTVDEKDKDLFLPAGAVGDGAIYTDHLAAIQIIRKVILRIGTKLDYLILKLH